MNGMAGDYSRILFNYIDEMERRGITISNELKNIKEKHKMGNEKKVGLTPNEFVERLTEAIKHDKLCEAATKLEIAFVEAKKEIVSMDTEDLKVLSKGDYGEIITKWIEDELEERESDEKIKEMMEIRDLIADFSDKHPDYSGLTFRFDDPSYDRYEPNRQPIAIKIKDEEDADLRDVLKNYREFWLGK